jgi:hypothetical protein
MVEHDTGGEFVDVLTAGSRRADKLFLDVLFPHTQGVHAF